MHGDGRRGAGGARLLGLGLGVLLVVAGPSVPAAAQAYSCTHDPVTDEVRCEVREESGSSSGGSSDGGGAGGASGDEISIVWPPPGMVVVTYPVLRTAPDGSGCVGTGARLIEARFADAIEAGRLARYEYDLARYLEAGNPPPGACPATGAPDPEELRTAVAAVVTHQLPRPVPTIAPGTAITGLPAYLETGRALRFTTAPVTLALSTGPVTVALEGVATSTVDWGDGHVDQGLTDPGGPWPDGTVTHTYLERERVEVQVTDRWEISFQAAGLAAQQLTVEVTGQPLELEVIEVRALRTTPG